MIHDLLAKLLLILHSLQVYQWVSSSHTKISTMPYAITLFVQEVSSASLTNQLWCVDLYSSLKLPSFIYTHKLSDGLNRYRLAQHREGNKSPVEYTCELFPDRAQVLSIDQAYGIRQKFNNLWYPYWAVCLSEVIGLEPYWEVVKAAWRECRRFLGLNHTPNPHSSLRFIGLFPLKPSFILSEKTS